MKIDQAVGRLDTSTLAWARVPRIRDLNARDAEVVLSRNRVGRVAFMGDGRLELLPIHYVYVDRTVVGRTGVGTKYLNWLTRDDVVFEVDESEGLFDWRSVVLRGKVSILRARGSGEQRAAYLAAVAAFRSLVPSTFTPRDPTPYRTVMFAIAPTSVTGREARTRGAS